ncbi:MAG: hypothetical protein H7Y33_02250 [Cytophagales bacterium]|nr:hypothetical protein [Rhizobacter sp.]
MKLIPFSLALALITAGATAGAAPADEHKGHHPAGAASAPVSKSTTTKTTPDMARMANQMKAMQEMHDKMMAAKTPDERNALMGEHMKTMHDGMAMMKGAGGMAAANKPPADMTQRQNMMEQRMDMMQTMMEMMVDRFPQSPAKP